MISRFDVFKSISGRGDFDGGGFGGGSLVQPKMNVTLTIGWFDVSFEVGEFEVGGGKADSNFVGNYILILGGEGDSQRRIGGKGGGDNQGRNEHNFILEQKILFENRQIDCFGNRRAHGVGNGNFDREGAETVGSTGNGAN